MKARIKLGDLDRGGDSPFPGAQDKLWRTHWVDSELKESWLERINDLSGVHILGVCAGHPAYRTPRSWLQKIVGMPEIFSLESAPYIAYEPLDDKAVSGLPQAFGDDAVYFEGDPFLSREQKMDLLETGASSMIIVKRDQSKDVHSVMDRFTGFMANLIGHVPEAVVNIQALKTRGEMTDTEFDKWFETTITNLEKIS